MATPDPKQFATREEVDQAISALSAADRLRLGQFSRWRIRGLGRASGGHDADDLLSEALIATIIGAETKGAEGRRWNKNVDFRRHLTEAMRSISSHWRDRYQEEAALDSDVAIVDEAGEVHSRVQEAPDKHPDVVREAIAKEELARILAKFRDDDDAILVLEGLREGWGRSDFGSIGMATSRYDATLKRIRYALRDEQ